MASQRHMQIINPVHKESGSFTLFSLLPPELRIEIWQLSLHRSRLINVELAPHRRSQRNQEPPSRGTQNEQDRLFSVKNYSITVNGTHLLSKLLRVSTEARQAALQFYRIHLPCRFELDQKEGFGMLPFNPEYDILHVHIAMRGYNLVEFLHDLRVHDPQGVGLLNLALEHDDVSSLMIIKPFNLDPAPWASFTDTIANLREFYFLCLEKAGRIHLGPRGGIHTVTGYEIHRSRPIMSTIPTFDRLKRDPRDGMTRDLSRVFVGTFDPRLMVWHWEYLLKKWHIHHLDRSPEYRFLVASGWGNGRMANKRKKISGRDSATEWLQDEDESWEQGQQRHAAGIVRRGGTVPVESPGELEHVPRPAIGFWLFPIEAIGPHPGPESLIDPEHFGFGWEPKRVVDMREHWPELCLTSMP
ncbi:hypothetical protein F4860DRAFT_497356 [Xylaria cubensis]|nr:hypothetical protein F4860DRAFT_497356 [Xylaria cubensis]